MDLSYLYYTRVWSTCGEEPLMLGQGPVPFSHRVMLRASRYLFGVFLVLDVHRGLRPAGIINYSLREQSICKCCDALPMMV